MSATITITDYALALDDVTSGDQYEFVLLVNDGAWREVKLTEHDLMLQTVLRAREFIAAIQIDVIVDPTTLFAESAMAQATLTEQGQKLIDLDDWFCYSFAIPDGPELCIYIGTGDDWKIGIPFEVEFSN